MAFQKRQASTLLKTIELLKEQAQTDEHGPEPSQHYKREFWIAVRTYRKPTKQCSQCRASYPFTMFKQKKHTFFYQGRWYVERESVCLPCEVQNQKVRRSAIALEMQL